MVDTLDSKSSVQKTWGFESPHPYSGEKMALVPNVDRPRGKGAPSLRESVVCGKAPDIEVDDRPRRTVRGKTRIALAVEWRQFFASVWMNRRAPDGGPLFALYPHIRWSDGSGKTGLMTLEEFDALPLAEEL